MLVLLFHIGGERWALAADEIVAVLPMVSLQPFAHGSDDNRQTAGSTNRSSPHSGLLNYHGDLLPTVDVSAVVANQCAPQALSTRIAVVKQPDQGQIALVLDRANETVRLSTPKAESVQLVSPYVQRLLQDPTQPIKLAVPLLRTDALLATTEKNRMLLGSMS